MKLQGHNVVILCCLLNFCCVQFSSLSVTRYVIFVSGMYSSIAIFGMQGLTFLVYPLSGHLADVYLTRYRTIKWSFVILIAGDAVLLVYTMVRLAMFSAGFSEFNIISDHFSVNSIVSSLLMGVGALLHIIGLGFAEANAIQFGLDQLLEAPTQKLVAFIHWYFWSQNIGSLVIFYIVAALLGSYGGGSPEVSVYVVAFVGLVFHIAAALATLSIFSYSKKHFYIQRAGLNPFKNLFKVLKYTWKHKVPENRSAFTYWEEDIPPRIDLGKDKYGGPFTTEEVEDAKIILCILPLLLSLFGFHLAEDGDSASDQFQRSSCPSLPVLILIVANPLHISTLVTVVGIPLYRLVIRKFFPCLGRVLMVTRMWMGLFLSLLQVIVYIIIAVNHDTTYWQEHRSSIKRVHPTSFYNPANNCYRIRTGLLENGTFMVFNDPVDNTYLWFIVPQILNGLSSLLVSMTALEFICAQAPHTTQGMLIGLWYATFSIRFLAVGIVDTLISERKSWLIYEGVKGFLILVSLVLFSCVSRHYRYRQRDEIVNVQWMIEEIFERRMDQEEEYMQERRALLASGKGHTNLQL